MLAYQHLQKHPRRTPQAIPGRRSSKTAPAPITLKSTPNSTPQDTQPSVLRKSTSAPNSIPNHHLSCVPPCTLPSRCKHAPAQSPACPIAPERQYCKNAPAPSPAPQTDYVPQHHQHQRPKLYSPLRPAVKMQKYACTVTPQNSTCKSTTNCMLPSTLASILKRCARTAISTSNSTPISTYSSTPNCTRPSTSPSISQITFPSLLEVRTPIAFSYLGKEYPQRKILMFDNADLPFAFPIKQAEERPVAFGVGPNIANQGKANGHRPLPQTYM